MKKIVFAIGVGAISTSMAWAGSACCGGGDTSGTSAKKATADIVDTAVAAGSFKTLSTALTEAGVVETLKGKGPFTVFAPTDEAFAALPAGTVEALLKDKAKLVAVLTYHVVPGKLMAADVVAQPTLKSVQGGRITVAQVDGAVKINDAKVAKADVVAKNGVIHVIDKVILPPEA